jgi:hypothetical protein
VIVAGNLLLGLGDLTGLAIAFKFPFVAVAAQHIELVDRRATLFLELELDHPPRLG